MEKSRCSVIDKYVSSESDDAVDICVKLIKEGTVKLVDFVSELGSSLTSAVLAVRRRGIQLLKDVTIALPSEFFVNDEVVLLLEFFRARLGDHHSIVPLCLSGIAMLLQHKTLGSSDVIASLRVIFSEVTVQTLVQSDRMLVYEMFDQLITNRLSDLQGIASEFVCGFVQAIDSEKDPRNLLKCFKLVKDVAEKIPLESALTEQLFEVVACYYPIDFTPPSSATVTVTKEELSAALVYAMTAAPTFGQFCVPLLLEKLSSNVTSAKVDSLRLLKRCCSMFYQKDLTDHLTALWNCIKSDVFAQRTDIEETALESLTVLVHTLSVSEDDGVVHCSVFVKAVFNDCAKYLYEPEQLACKQATKLLSAVCAASAVSCQWIFQLVVPVVISEFHTCVLSGKRQGLLTVLKNMLLAADSLFLNEDDKSPIADFKESLIDVYVSLLLNSDMALRLHGVSGITSLMTAASLLTEDECRLLMQHLLNILLSDCDSSVTQETTASMVLVAAKQPDSVCQTLLPVLSDILQGSVEQKVIKGPHVNKSFIVNLLSSISVHPVVTVDTIPMLFEQLCSMILEPVKNAEEFHQCCVCLTSVVAVMSGDCWEFFLCWLAPRCIAITLHICTTLEPSVATQQLVAELAGVIRTVVQHSKHTSSLRTFLSGALSAFLYGDVTEYRTYVNVTIGDFLPITSDFPSHHICSIALLTAVTCSCPYSLISEASAELINRLLAITTRFSEDMAYVHAYKCLAGLINRRPADEFLDRILHSLESSVSEVIHSSDASCLSSKHLALLVCIWVTKALVMRNHSQQTVFLTLMQDAMRDNELAGVAADGYKLILSDDTDSTEHIFSEISGATKTLMYKQRCFTVLLPQLLADYQLAVTSNSDNARYYVLTLAHLMQSVPQQVLISELPRLMPVLLQCLSSDNEEPQVWLTTLDTVTGLIADSSEVIQSYLDDLLSRLLLLCSYRPMLKVRVAAVRAIGELSAMPVHLILPRQQKVLQQLGIALDDHKRLVRQEAAVARCRWYMVGAPDS